MIKKAYRSNSKYYKRCKKLVINFVEYELGGRIDSLKTFCFDDLKWGSKYCYPEGDNSWEFDCDNTALAQAIYVVLWGHIYDIKEGDIGSWSSDEKKSHDYRGDTINSFNSLFGELPYMHRAKNHHLDEDVYLWKEILAFSWMYHTIGNFILLPNKSNLNCERGRKGDYFDLFLMDINEYQKDINYQFGVEAIKDNKFLLDTKLENLKADFYLELFFKDNQPSNLYDMPRNDRRIQTLNKNEERYKDLVRKYLITSEKIIVDRSNKIIDELRSALNTI
jgi:hypothetical protein